MTKKPPAKPVPRPIVLHRDSKDRMIPEDFKGILFYDLLPVISISYLATVLGYAICRMDIMKYIFFDPAAYEIGFIVALWISFPAIIWIFLRNLPEYRHCANDWYKITAGLMTATLLLSFVLFPEIEVLAVRVFMAASIPAFALTYFFFVKGGLPASSAHPLNAAGIAMFFYGILTVFIF